MMENKIAYILLAHNDPKHLERLVNILNEHADFYIHIDKKSDLNDFSALLSYDNIMFVDDRIDVSWGGFSMVEAITRAIKILLSESKIRSIRYKKIILLSGACYPIKDNNYIHSFMEESIDHNFINAMNVSRSELKARKKAIERYHFYDLSIFGISLLKRILRRLLFHVLFFVKKNNYIIDDNNDKLEIFHGSQWWAVNHDVLEYFSTYFDNKKFNQYFKYSMAPDENYFHTIFHNSPFSTTTLIKKEHKRPSFFANIHIIHPSLSKWYNEDDFEAISKSKKLFVRKVSSKTSKKLLDLLDVKCLNPQNKIE